MHDYKKYDRAYILLTPESNGYAIPGQKLSGTAILEIRNGKGKITANVQGVKPPGASAYMLYLICSRDNGAIGVCCGAFMPDQKGKAAKTWDFDPVNVGGSGIEYNDFNVIAVIVKSSELTNEIIAPLVGYKNGAVIWKSGFKEYKKETANRAQAEVIAEVEPPLPSEPTSPPEQSALPQVVTEAVTEDTEDTEDTADKTAVAEARSVPADTLHKELLERLKYTPSHKDFCNTDEYHENLKKAIPSEKYEKLLRITITVVDYTHDDELEHLLLLLTEALGITPHLPYEERNPLNELLTTVDGHIPGKVKEALAEACEDALPYVKDAEYERLAHVLKATAEFYRIVMQSEGEGEDLEDLEYYSMEDTNEGQTEPAQAEETEQGDERGRIRLTSGLTGEYTMREPVPGEDHNARFKENLRNFAESFNEETSNEEAPHEEVLSEALDASVPLPEDAVSATLNKQEKMPFDETGINDLFNKREQMQPFHGGRGGYDRNDRNDRHDRGRDRAPYPVQPGFPPIVPPVIPIFDIRWIRITQDDIRLLPERIWKYAGNPFVIRSFRKYEHLIFGVSGHGTHKTYYFGVPGAYSERDRLMASSLGFTSFLPVSGGAPRHGEFGYWIMNV